MHILHEMGKTLDSDMHFEVGRSGDWSIRTLNDTLMGATETKVPLLILRKDFGNNAGSDCPVYSLDVSCSSSKKLTGLATFPQGKAAIIYQRQTTFDK